MGHRNAAQSPLRISRAERKLYTLIAGRMEAVKATLATYQVANYSVEIAGVRCSYEWILDQPKPEYIGSSKQQFTVNTVGVCPVSPSVTLISVSRHALQPVSFQQ